jgi:hypothetical protein
MLICGPTDFLKWYRVSVSFGNIFDRKAHRFGANLRRLTQSLLERPMDNSVNEMITHSGGHDIKFLQS